MLFAATPCVAMMSLVCYKISPWCVLKDALF